MTYGTSWGKEKLLPSISLAFDFFKMPTGALQGSHWEQGWGVWHSVPLLTSADAPFDLHPFDLKCYFSRKGG